MNANAGVNPSDETRGKRCSYRYWIFLPDSASVASHVRADWFLGYDPISERYVWHLMDIFGARYSETLGCGTRDGSQIHFVFEYPDGPFRNTAMAHGAKRQKRGMVVVRRPKAGQGKNAASTRSVLPSGSAILYLWERNARQQSSPRGFIERDGAAIEFGQVADDRQAETRAGSSFVEADASLQNAGPQSSR